ncbi:hypothetical protein ACWD5V_14425 [Streptomyces sp. NPDC002523]
MLPRRVRAGAETVYGDGPAPIVPLPVAQIEHALGRSPRGRRRPTGPVTAYRLDRFSRTRTREIYDGVPEPGRHRVPLDPEVAQGETLLVARTTGSVLVEPV